MADVRQHIARFEALKHLKAHWEETFQQVSDHVIGRRYFTRDEIVRGEQRMDQIFDGTGRLATNRFTAALQSLLFQADWFRIVPEDKRLLEVREVVLWYEVVQEILLAEFDRPESNFDTQVKQTLGDEVSFGTGGMFVADDPGGGVIFTARPISELYIAENAVGMVDTVFARRTMTARQLIQTFGEGASPKAERLLASNQAEQTMPVLHLVRPRDDPAPGRIDAAGMAWESVYISEEEKTTLREGGFHENPYMTPRWEVDAGDVYGRSPGIDTLPDQKMLNEMSRTMIAMAQRAVAPPVMVDDDGVLTQLDMNPLGVNIVRNEGGNTDPIREITTRSNFAVGDAMIGQRKEQVEEAFFSQILAVPRNPHMTATQVLELRDQTIEAMAPIIKGQQRELAEPMVERVFGIALRQGRLPEPPAILQGTNVRVEYQSPVARVQKQGRKREMMEAIQVGIQLAQANPDSLDNVDFDEFYREFWKLTGTSVKILRSREDVEQMRKVRAEIVNQQAQIDQASQVAEAAGKAAPALDLIQGGGGAA